MLVERLNVVVTTDCVIVVMVGSINDSKLLSVIKSTLTLVAMAGCWLVVDVISDDVTEGRELDAVRVDSTVTIGDEPNNVVKLGDTLGPITIVTGETVCTTVMDGTVVVEAIVVTGNNEVCNVVKDTFMISGIIVLVEIT